MGSRTVHPGCSGIHRCLCLGTQSTEATGQSRWKEEAGGLGSGMPGREAAPFVHEEGGGGGREGGGGKEGRLRRNRPQDFFFP